MEEEEEQLSSDMTYLMKGAMFVAFIGALFILWRTIVQQEYLMSYVWGFALVLSILRVLVTPSTRVKKVYLNYSSGEFRFRNFSGEEEPIPFKDFIGYRFIQSRTVRLEFSGDRRRYFIRPVDNLEPNPAIRQKLDEILARNKQAHSLS